MQARVSSVTGEGRASTRGGMQRGGGSGGRHSPCPGPAEDSGSSLSPFHKTDGLLALSSYHGLWGYSEISSARDVIRRQKGTDRITFIHLKNCPSPRTNGSFVFLIGSAPRAAVSASCLAEGSRASPPSAGQLPFASED